MTVSGTTQAQQVADTDFSPPIAKPAFAEGEGPVVLLDEAHYNFHTASGRYLPFANLLRRDGYIVKASAAKFTPDVLGERKDSGHRQRPAAKQRGRVVAAESIGFYRCGNCRRACLGERGRGADADRRSPAVSRGRGAACGRIRHPFRGRTPDEAVDAIATFTGSAFRIDRGEALFRLSDSAMAFMPKVFGGPFHPDMPKTPVGGWLQGAVLHVGKGRVAVFGEAAMFSAQVAGPEKMPMGMNAPPAKQNPQFLLNVMHWLSGLLP